MIQYDKFKDTNIYRSLEILIKEYCGCYVNMRNDIKSVLGKDLFDLLSKCIGLMSRSYISNDLNKKLDYAMDLKEHLFEFEVKMKILKDAVQMVNDTKYGQIAIQYGKIEHQLNKWIESLNEKKKSRIV